MHILTSIESLDKESGIINTGSKPIRVHASDGENYICKYNTGYGSANSLFKEFIIVNFLKVWELPYAEFALIKIDNAHIPTGFPLPRRFFDKETFASRKIANAEVLNLFTEDSLVRIDKKSLLREMILTIIFFDIWVSNEDRHPTNYNLIYTLNGEHSIIYPIDHEACFNHGNFAYGLQTLTYQETLISSSFFNKMFTNRYLIEKLPFPEFNKKIYLCIQRCKDKLDEILYNVPPSWLINTEDKKNQLETHLFAESWITNCWTTFLTYLAQFRMIRK